MEITYPSTEFPAPPRFRLTGPEGWEPVRSPDVAAGVAAPAQPNYFRPNLVVTLSRIVGSLDVNLVVDRQVAEAEDQLQARVTARETKPLAGIDAVWTAYAVPAYEGRKAVAQFVVTLLLPRSETLGEIVTVTCSCDAEQVELYTPVFRDCLKSFTVWLD